VVTGMASDGVNIRGKWRETNRLMFERLPDDLGLSSTAIFDILQTADGYLWIATKDSGINRYDGDQVIHYNYETGEAHGLACPA